MSMIKNSGILLQKFLIRYRRSLALIPLAGSLVLSFYLGHYLYRQEMAAVSDAFPIFNTTDGIIGCDTADHIAVMNSQAERLTGYSALELEIVGTDILITAADLPKHQEGMDRLRKELSNVRNTWTAPKRFSSVIIRKNGKKVMMDLILRGVTNTTGDIRFIIAMRPTEGPIDPQELLGEDAESAFRRLEKLRVLLPRK